MAIDQQHGSSADIVDRITALAPQGVTQTPALLDELRSATADLIASFQAEGKLAESPMTLAMTRTVDLHEAAARTRLEGRRVLVTGGAGCVGTRLIPLLVELGAAEIAIVDFAEEESQAPKSTTYKVDIRDNAALNAVFAEVKPHVVFHLASVREPGRAEAVVREAIETNVFATRNVIEACLRHGVEDAIYSSTGKCFAYVSGHVYTGSKKLAEAQWAVAARNSRTTRFRCTRFTHVMENGIITQDIVDGIDAGLVGLHGPDRNFNVQNLRQATHLLVNALALADQTPVDGFWSAVDLGWPVNTLELALFKIVESGKPVAVTFQGVPKGYDEVFFRGQFAWDNKTEYHPLINAMEGPSGFSDDSGTMTGARIQPFDESALALELIGLQAALDNDALDVSEVKDALLAAVAGLARAVFAAADLARVIDILWWGAAPAWAGPNASGAAKFSSVIRLLADNVAMRLDGQGDALDCEIRQKLSDVAQTLALIDDLQPQSRRFDALLADQQPVLMAANAR